MTIAEFWGSKSGGHLWVHPDDLTEEQVIEKSKPCRVEKLEPEGARLEAIYFCTFTLYTDEEWKDMVEYYREQGETRWGLVLCGVHIVHPDSNNPDNWIESSMC